MSGCYAHERGADDASAPDAASDVGSDAGPIPFDPSRLSLCRVIEWRELVAISPDGSHAALEGEASVLILDTHTGTRERQIFTIRDEAAADVVGFTTDSAALVVRDPGVIAVYDLATGVRTATPMGAASPPIAATVVPAGVILVVDDVVESLPFGGVPRVLTRVAPGEGIQQVTLLPSGELLLVGGTTMRTIALDDGHDLASATYTQATGAYVLGTDVIAVSTEGGTGWFDSPSLARLTGPTSAVVGPSGATHYITGDGAMWTWSRTGSSIHVTQDGGGFIVSPTPGRRTNAASPTVLGAGMQDSSFVFLADADGHTLSRHAD